ncbi:MAG TPA: SDR family NAD(P)-dependent oxidoreductase, partial [Candidatus Competibacteraceae bacterium]|nr:SDR family NAD(P)-dependent oxidoreductase [Candidatus Competibacteraceae bacterium]
DLAGVRQRATRQLDRTALYRLFEQAGVACGPYCQGVAELWLGENEALAELRLPAGEAAALPYYTLHPTLLDGAFQTAMAWLAAQPGAADRVLVPFTVGEVKILQAPGTETCAYVQCRDVADARFDIALLDAEGRLQARLLDFRATALHAPERASPSDHFDAARSPALARKESIDPMPCYRPVWREEPLPTSGSAQPEGIALIVHPLEDPSLGERLARELTPRITLRVAIGQTGQSLAPGVFEIDQQQVDAWQQLCATLKPVAAVYFCATAEQAGDPLDLTSVEAAVRRGSLSLLRLVQALRQTSRGQPGLTLAVITQNAQLVMADDAVNPLSADVLGLTQTLSREVRDWRVSLVDVVRWDEASILEGLLAELGTEPGLAVAWRAGVRYCRFLEPVTVPEPVQSPFREQGVYVLAGGGGGLGLTVAQHLAATYRARVLLLGRSPLDVDRQRQVAEIAGTGGEVIHRTCDITDPTAIQMALTGARQRWGAVHGVMQAAMVLCDRALDHLDEESFQAVLAPKVQGSVALAQAVIGQPLDFFAFFSSANAFVGNVGQGNYAAASTFQDAFAHFLRQRGAWPVYLLNWGFWGEVGAVADPFHIRQAARLGIGAIGRAEGIDILERILASPSGQWMPMKASPTILTKLGLRCYEPLPQADGDAGFMALAGRLRQAATANPETASIAAAFTQVEAYGRALLARVWQEQGVLAVGQRFTTETLAQQLGLEPAHTRLLEALLALLAEDGWLLREENGWRGSPRLPEARGATIGALPPWTAPFIGVLEHCLRAYPQLLRGERAATEVLFGAEILPLVQALYRDNPIVAQYNRLCAEVIAARAAEVLQRQDRCRILEIGAGTGGTSAAALAALAPLGECIEYRYTDLSAGLVQQARRQFAADYPFARFLVLDIESNPAEQGIEPGSCDMVLAANVLHATARIHQTLRHVRQTLRPGGVLILNEAIHRQDFSTLTFGLTEGWWRFVDGKYRLPYSPLLSEASWRRILLTCGFQGLASATTDSDAQTVILAQADDRSPVGAAVVATTPHHAVVPSAISPPPEDSGDLPVWVEQKVRRALAQTLNLAPGEIDHRRRFADYGVDSILGVDLMTRLSDELGVILRATLLFDYACVADLSAHLIAAHEPELAARRAATFAGESSPVVDAGALFGRSVTSSPDPSPSRLEEKGHSGTGLVERIAIVGMAGRFPGAANLDAFWADLQAGRCRVTEVPAERWDVSAYYDPDPHQPDKSPCKWGGFLEGIADFDPLFFQMSGAEAEFTDPQQRLFMEEAWSALEHAGYSDRWLNQRRAGVFVGVGAGDYTHKMVAAGLDASPYAFMGNGAAMLAGRIAYLLNLRGPALAVDTACSSSLVALHLACQSLRAGECELALAGGVFVATTPGFHALTGRLGMLSSTGQCRVFDQNANGFVPGEGVGVVVLRPLEAAVQDGDTIHGVIVASGSNQDGRSNGIAAPSALAQRELLETVYAQSGVNPATISYVEAHGTGTKLGDPIEFEALNGAFRHFTDQRSFCTLGSVKANIGHAGPAAGVAGLLKVLLMLKHRQWPPLLHFTAPNPHITLADSPFYINRELQDWPAALDHPRRAAISSFGLSGTNAHVVVEEPPLPIAPSVATGQQHLLAISAHVPASLQTRLAQLQDWLAGEGSAVSMAD